MDLAAAQAGRLGGVSRAAAGGPARDGAERLFWLLACNLQEYRSAVGGPARNGAGHLVLACLMCRTTVYGRCLDTEELP